MGADYKLGKKGTDYDGDGDLDFDCSGLVSWACEQLGVQFPNWSGHQIDACADVGREISVDDARSIRGALLFRPAGHQGKKYNHIALSLGSDDDTIEAMGRDYGVRRGEIGRRFTRAGLIPGIVYDHE